MRRLLGEYNPNNDLSDSTTVLRVKNKNYKMNLSDKYIRGYASNLEAMKQVIYKILNTERYNYIIYSWNYGIELKDLFGKPIDYVCPEVERRVKESLVHDNRIEKVYNFKFDKSRKGVVSVSFVVRTIYGEADVVKEVVY